MRWALIIFKKQARMWWRSLLATKITATRNNIDTMPFRRIWALQKVQVNADVGSPMAFDRSFVCQEAKKMAYAESTNTCNDAY